MAKKNKNSDLNERGNHPIPFEQEKEKFMGMVGDVLSNKDFANAEEATKFLNDAFTGRSMSDSLAEWDTRPPSLIDEAREVLSQINRKSPPTTQRRYAQKALEITHDCMEGWEALAWSYQSFKKIEECLLKGIAHGRKLHMELIANVNEEHGLWGYHETRPFLLLFENLTDLYSQEGLTEKTVEVYEELLTLNPGDNQGIRGKLLHGYIKLNRLDNARQLADKFEDDIDLGIIYGRLLLELTRISQTEYDFDKLVNKARKERLSPAAFDTTFTKAKSLIREALKMNPYVPLLINHPTSMYAESPYSYQMGSPDQAMIFIKDYGIDWFGSMIGWLFLGAFSAQAEVQAKKDQRDFRESYKELVDFLDGIDQEPWQNRKWF